MSGGTVTKVFARVYQNAIHVDFIPEREPSHYPVEFLRVLVHRLLHDPGIVFGAATGVFPRIGCATIEFKSGSAPILSQVQSSVNSHIMR